MYNRYIPQSDGTYQRKRIQERTPPPKPEKPPEVVPPPPCPAPEPPKRPLPPPRHRNGPTPRREQESITGFLRQLLPKGFDTGDLLVILLLLLMSGDCQEDQNTALLTLALYLFM